MDFKQNQWPLSLAEVDDTMYLIVFCSNVN